MHTKKGEVGGEGGGGGELKLNRPHELTLRKAQSRSTWVEVEWDRGIIFPLNEAGSCLDDREAQVSGVPDKQQGTSTPPDSDMGSALRFKV
ncbi:hypothetical protein O3P69_000937 [Scylla paramamosain]|uniref:Uncharacterized protein n=1 Tax=Scylla paramamosain TaxID=85552 RepID=A0AAW0USQ7_SCYPA